MESFVVRESYDYPNKIASVQMTSLNRTTKSIIDFEAGERYSFAPNETCMTYSINDRGPNNIFGFLLRGNGSVQFATSADVFKFGRTYNETYVGTDEIRGIPVNRWASCQHSDDLHSTFRLDYYFSRDNFLSPTNDTNIPIRITITGEARNEDKQGNVKPTGSHNYTHVYEYSYFKPGPIKDQTVFHSPKGIVCKGRKNVKQLPKMPEQFTVDIETKNSVQSRTFRVYFDNSFNLTRTDTFYTLGARSQYGGGLVSVIQDLHSEVVYVVNQHEGNCTMYSLQSQPDKHMKYVYELLNVKNKTYVYQGKRMLRDMVVDAWGNITNDGIVQEMYFVPPPHSRGLPNPRQRRAPGSGQHSGRHSGQHSGQPGTPGSHTPPPFAWER
ncbi:uncharacterized protein LOC121373012 [Gigantopelta aegis]|uniref:uncharacterized protein LOC121373012 n=1 Tax=Gigantopelta aegis TaxID=1735272 RepID=UPI001B88D23A|nr:uncharacterized protein LOC121373012 [Gigantopelta aegis]